MSTSAGTQSTFPPHVEHHRIYTASSSISASGVATDAPRATRRDSRGRSADRHRVQLDSPRRLFRSFEGPTGGRLERSVVLNSRSALHPSWAATTNGSGTFRSSLFGLDNRAANHESQSRLSTTTYTAADVATGRTAWLDSSGTLFKHWGSRNVMTSKTTDKLRKARARFEYDDMLSKSIEFEKSVSKSVEFPPSAVATPVAAHLGGQSISKPSATGGSVASHSVSPVDEFSEAVAGGGGTFAFENKVKSVAPVSSTSNSKEVLVALSRTKGIGGEINGKNGGPPSVGRLPQSVEFSAASSPEIEIVASRSGSNPKPGRAQVEEIEKAAAAEPAAEQESSSKGATTATATARPTKKPASRNINNNARRDEFRTRLTNDKQQAKFVDEQQQLLTEKYQLLQQSAVKMRSRIGECERVIATLRHELLTSRRHEAARDDQLKEAEERLARDREWFEQRMETQVRRSSTLLSEKVTQQIKDECQKEIAAYRQQLEVAKNHIRKLEEEAVAKMKTHGDQGLYVFGLETDKQHLEAANLELQARCAHLEAEVLRAKGEAKDLRTRNAFLGRQVVVVQEEKAGAVAEAAGLAAEVKAAAAVAEELRGSAEKAAAAARTEKQATEADLAKAYRDEIVTRQQLLGSSVRPAAPSSPTWGQRADFSQGSAAVTSSRAEAFGAETFPNPGPSFGSNDLPAGAEQDLTQHNPQYADGRRWSETGIAGGARDKVSRQDGSKNENGVPINSNRGRAHTAESLERVSGATASSAAPAMLLGGQTAIRPRQSVIDDHIARVVRQVEREAVINQSRRDRTATSSSSSSLSASASASPVTARPRIDEIEANINLLTDAKIDSQFSLLSPPQLWGVSPREWDAATVNRLEYVDVLPSSSKSKPLMKAQVRASPSASSKELAENYHSQTSSSVGRYARVEPVASAIEKLVLLQEQERTARRRPQGVDGVTDGGSSSSTSTSFQPPPRAVEGEHSLQDSFIEAEPQEIDGGAASSRIVSCSDTEAQRKNLTRGRANPFHLVAAPPRGPAAAGDEEIIGTEEASPVVVDVVNSTVNVDARDRLREGSEDENSSRKAYEKIPLQEQSPPPPPPPPSAATSASCSSSSSVCAAGRGIAAPAVAGSGRKSFLQILEGELESGPALDIVHVATTSTKLLVDGLPQIHKPVTEVEKDAPALGVAESMPEGTMEERENVIEL